MADGAGPARAHGTRKHHWWVAGRSMLYPLVLLAIFLGGWELTLRIFEINPFVLPSPRAVWDAFLQWRGTLFTAALVTLRETIYGFAIAVGTGILLGVLMAFSTLARVSLYPLLVASQMVPKVALAPIFIVWFGLGLTSKVTIAFLVAFFPIIVATLLGMEQAEPDQVRLFRSMRASGLQTFLKLRLPAALPSIFSGMKVAITLAIVGAIVGEFIGGDAGVGYFVINQTGQLNTAAVYAGLLMVTIIGILLYFALELVEWLVSPGRKSHTAGSKRLAV